MQCQDRDMPFVLIESVNDVEINGLFKCPRYLLKFHQTNKSKNFNEIPSKN